MRRFFSLLLLALLLSSCQEIVEKEADEKIARAEAALQEEDWQVADNAFYEAILLDPDRAEAWIGRGMTLTQLKDTDYARDHYEEALAIYTEQLKEDPADFEALRRQIMLLVLLNRADEARDLADKALAEHPGESRAQQLPALVNDLEEQFEEMILPPPQKEKAASMFETDPLRPEAKN